MAFICEVMFHSFKKLKRALSPVKKNHLRIKNKRNVLNGETQTMCVCVCACASMRDGGRGADDILILNTQVITKDS